MQRFSKNGKDVDLSGIYEEGRIGQVVILALVDFGEDADPAENPFCCYPQPSVFVITEKTKGKGWHYTFRDAEGKEIVLPGDHSDTSWLYDANDWLAWDKQSTEAKEKNHGRMIEDFRMQLSLLQEILTRQGCRIITEEQAKSLGIKG